MNDVVVFVGGVLWIASLVKVFAISRRIARLEAERDGE